jgi:hypothetical protein
MLTDGAVIVDYSVTVAATWSWSCGMWVQIVVIYYHTKINYLVLHV